MDDVIERSNDEIDIGALHRRYAAERAALPAALQRSEIADETAWVEAILAGMPRWREFQNNCVPSAYNYDGHVTKSVQYNLFHPAGPLAYMDRLAKWREESSFQGLERTYDTAGA